MSTDKKSTGRGRTRNFATVIYPESAPDNWKEILQEQFIPCFISPLHNLDTNPTGEVKKEHFHIILMFEGVKTIDQAREIFVKIGGVGCEIVQSLRGYARYLCHLDNPEKVQYNREDVISFCGADYHSVIGLALDKYQAIGEIMDYIDENHIKSYRDLLQYCRTERKDWFRVLCDSGTYVILEYIKSGVWSDSNFNKI